MSRENIDELLSLANGYGYDYDCKVVIIEDIKEHVLPLSMIVATQDEDDEPNENHFELREEPDYLDRIMYSLLQVGQPETQRTYFSGSGKALFSLLYA